MTRHRADDLDVRSEPRPITARFARVNPTRRARRLAGLDSAVAAAQPEPGSRESPDLDFVVATEAAPMRVPGPPQASAGSDPAGDGQPSVQLIPVGIRHAVGASVGRHSAGPSRTITACGLDAVAFHRFPDLEWITTVNQCVDCGQAMAWQDLDSRR